LPGGKVEEREEPEAALVREIGEELGVALVIEGSVRRYESSLSGRPFLFLVFPSRFASEEFRLSAHDRWGYFGADELGGLELAPLDGPSLRDWAARLEG
jgi:8-oxo-dGTP diphosphatase